MRRNLKSRTFAAAGLISALLLLPSAIYAGEPASSANSVMPAGFEDSLVAAVQAPTALAFVPDGRVLITTQTGRIRVFQSGGLNPTAALDLESLLGSDFCDDSERGLLGIAVDSSFATNNYVYVYYTSALTGSCANRVSRFVLPSSNVIDPASETVLIDRIPSPDGNHNGGDLEFGKDGLLYISVGDGSCDYNGDSGCGGENDASRDQNVLLGKVLRITRDGDIPATNPFQGAGTDRCRLGKIAAGQKCRETFAWGLRNPFRLAFDPNAAGTRFFINDVGQWNWEEIDEATSGADYGWNVREGPCRQGDYTNCGPLPAGMTDPIFAYRHDLTGCASITGGAFVPDGVWPAEYDGDYLYADYVCGKIFRLEQSGDAYTSSEFVTGLGSSSAVHIRFGPAGSTQALYYTTYADGGQVRRIAFTGGANRTPSADLTASPTFGPAPLDVGFDGGGSNDPDPGDTLTYVWDFGDGSPGVETAVPTISHRYTSAGAYTASLKVRDNHGSTSTADTVRIDAGNTPPVPTIAVPSASQRFAVGEVVVLQGTAVDAQDGTLADSRLSWNVLRHHGTDHTHPWLPDTAGNNVPMPASPSPEDVFSAATSYLEIRLTATDSNGLSATAIREFRPTTVDLTFQTVPAGLHLGVFAAEVTAPFRLPAWEAWQFGVSARRQGDALGRTWIFDSWSDGGSASHTITTGTTPTTYTASFHENRSPVAGSVAVAAVEDVTETVTLPATDADADSLIYHVTRSPANGTVGAPSGDRIVYTPNAQFHGQRLLRVLGNRRGRHLCRSQRGRHGDRGERPADRDLRLRDDCRGHRCADRRPGQRLQGPPERKCPDADHHLHRRPAARLSDHRESGASALRARRRLRGPDSFGYRVCDNGTTNGAPDPLCANGTIDVSVTPVNDTPIAGNDSAVTPGSTSASIDVSANDRPGPLNESGQALTLQPPSNPLHGAAVIEAGKVRYTPDAGFAGLDGFGYSTCDNGAPVLCASATVSINVTGANHVRSRPREPRASRKMFRSTSAFRRPTRTATRSRYDRDPAVARDAGHSGRCERPLHPGGGLQRPGQLRLQGERRPCRVWLRGVLSDGEGGERSTGDGVRCCGVGGGFVRCGGLGRERPARPPNESGQTLRVSAVAAPAHGSAVLLTSGLDAARSAVRPRLTTTVRTRSVIRSATTARQRRARPEVRRFGDSSREHRCACEPRKCRHFTAWLPHVTAEFASATLTVTAVNDPPVPAPDVAVTAEDSPVVVDLVANDLPGPPNESGQTLRVSAVAASAHGSAVL